MLTGYEWCYERPMELQLRNNVVGGSWGFAGSLAPAKARRPGCETRTGGFGVIRMVNSGIIRGVWRMRIGLVGGGGGVGTLERYVRREDVVH